MVKKVATPVGRGQLTPSVTTSGMSRDVGLLDETRRMLNCDNMNMEPPIPSVGKADCADEVEAVHVGHKQAWVKVNTHVDQGVAMIVEALSLFEKLRTIESCQGEDGEDARVWFVYGIEGEEETVEFVKALAPALYEMVGDSARLSVDWATQPTWPKALITVRPGPRSRKQVEKALAKLSTSLRLRDLVADYDLP